MVQGLDLGFISYGLELKDYGLEISVRVYGLYLLCP